ncbi:MAG TPA: single-stranded DNA-binding protein, partial [Kofleriaceae bacterium]|nr:single-stranded DNA-binding protein [Kofleriaceae bacterium]
CDSALAAAIDALAPRQVIGIGGFAAKRIREAIADSDLPVGQILHPSPASPRANRGWAAEVERDLATLGIPLPQAPSIIL